MFSFFSFSLVEFSLITILKKRENTMKTLASQAIFFIRGQISNFIVQQKC
jgi:hypothetical protein